MDHERVICHATLSTIVKIAVLINMNIPLREVEINQSLQQLQEK